MGKVRTSASFYSRGIPKDFHNFAYLTQANYPIIQPQQGILRLLNNNRSKIISRFRGYMGVNLYNSRYY
jgi:hypothetical protein